MLVQCPRIVRVVRVVHIVHTVLRILFMSMLLGAAALLNGCSRGPSQGQHPGVGGPPPVSVVAVTRRMVEEFDEFSARLAAVEQVEVRARVAGTLERVHFRDGEVVKKGAPLFTIDPRPFAAEVARNEASLASARTQASLAKSELVRADQLLPTNAISKQEADQRRSAAQNTAINIDVAKAALDVARLNLDYTSITAPISGRMSRTMVTAGNLISVNDTLLTTIVSIDPVYAYFDVGEDAYLKYGQAAAKPKAAQPEVKMGLFNEEGFPSTGKIDFVDNRMNPATGSMQLRAVFANKDGRFTPGLSARIRIGAGKPYEATLVPDRAISTDQTRKIVMVVGPKNVVEQREVKTGALIGAMRVVEGVKPGEHIIVDGLQRAFPGAPVTPTLVPVDASGMPLPAPPAPQAPPGKG